MGAGERFTPFRDQCAELRSLQNMRHQGSQSEHHLGSSRGRWRAKLSEYVNGFFTHIPHAGLSRPIWLLFRIPISLRSFEPEFPRKSAAVRRTLNRIPRKLLSDRPRRHDAALIPAFKGDGHARSGQLLRAGPKQSILLNAAAPRAFVRQMESTVILSPPLRRAAVAAMAALAITWPAMLCARAQQPLEGLSRTSPAGSYLAARHAGGQRDAAAAAAYYRAALRSDPRNNELLGRAFLAVLANGEVEEGVKLAERVLQVDKNDRIARLVLGVRAIKQKQYATARRELAQSIRGPITDLAATLLSAWTMANPAEAKQATD